MAKKKIIIRIRSLEETFKDSRKFASDLDKGIFKKHTPTIGFASYEVYKKMLTEKRLELLGAIKTKKPRSIKELATISKRDFKNVYDDVKMLENLGLIKLKKDTQGLIPIALYDEIDINIKIPLNAISA